MYTDSAPHGRRRPFWRRLPRTILAPETSGNPLPTPCMRTTGSVPNGVRHASRSRTPYTTMLLVSIAFIRSFSADRPTVNLYGVAFSHSTSHSTPRVALTSFISSSATNKIQIIQANATPTAKDDFRVLTSAFHAYPPTKIGFEPVNPITATPTHRGRGSSGESENSGSELLATTGDLLRIWELQEDWHAAPSSRRIGEGNHQHAKEQNPWRDDTGRLSMDSIDENQPAWRLKERSKLSNVGISVTCFDYSS